MKKLLLPGLVAGLVMLVVSTALNFLWPAILPSVAAEYNSPLFRPWSDPLMSLVFVCVFLTGFVMAWMWDAVKGSIKNSVTAFAGALSLLALLGIFMSYSCFPMSFLMTVTWIVSTVIQYYLGAWVLAKMNK